MSRHILSFHATLPLALIRTQQPQDDLLAFAPECSAWKKFPHLIGAEADLFALVGFGLGENADNYDVPHFAVLENIDDMLRYGLAQTLVQGIGFKRCKNCGMLFVPAGRSDSLYCGFIAKGASKPCNKTGANRQARKSRQ